jgi:tetratricopeptide (TPR) repeat protein/transglutaminase-like putative cysteine protease
MSWYSRWLPAVWVFLLLAGGFSQTSTQTPQTNSAPGAGSERKLDNSKEAFINEQDLTDIAFENDGTATRESSARIRIQSDAGVQRYGVLTFSYQSAIDSIEIDYVRVRKPDGTVITTPPDNTQDMPAEITRQTPFYSDLREKHVAVKGLGVGDVLETHARWRITKPLAPGQFWFVHTFPKDVIVLDQELRISIPRDRAVKWRSPTYKPDIKDDGSRRIFTWKYSHLEQQSTEERKKEQEEQTYKAARGKLPAPDVQISTFQSWKEIGSWYNKLQVERVQPTAEIQAKAAELTKTASDDDAKIRAIYNYVSTQFHYIGVAFGIGRYQPHSASEVLANQYGDCKDKHTLLASLLAAVGVKSYPVLINTFHDLDVELPSPAQFDHVITAIPQSAGYIWLDTTAEIAPFGYLIGALRNKQALVIPSDNPALLVTTPAEPPMKALETFRIDAKLSDDGTLEGKVERSVTGDDSEIILRAGFRRVPITQWKDLVQGISYGSGFSGEVSDVIASPPEKTDEPFHFSYNYLRKDFPQWSEHRIACALPPLLAAAPDEKPSLPIILGMIGEMRYESRVELPKGYTPHLPAKLEVREDFADYTSVYSFDHGVLQTTRTLSVKKHEAPPDVYDAYKKFAKVVADDYDRYVELALGNAPVNPLQTPVGSLGVSENSEAMGAFGNAMSEIKAGDIAAAEKSLNEAIRADPKFGGAWITLAQLYATTGRKSMAIETLERAYKADPGEPIIYKALVATLMGQHDYPRAVSVLQEVSKSEPENSEVLSILGRALFAMKRYGEAAGATESAIKLAPDRPELYAQLGSAYILSGDREKAVTAYKKALDLKPEPDMYNDIAYSLAENDTDLPLALEYAQKAVKDEEQISASIELSDLTIEDLQHTSALASLWDTLGWVYFKLGKLDEAENYLNAAWTVSQESVMADHLREVRAKQHKGSTLPDENQARTTKLPRLLPGNDSAEFFVLFAGASKTATTKADEVKFVSGSEKLRSAEKVLRSINFKMPFPDDGPTHIVRRGILGCYTYTGCSFVLLKLRDVHSVN